MIYNHQSWNIAHEERHVNPCIMSKSIQSTNPHFWIFTKRKINLVHNLNFIPLYFLAYTQIMLQYYFRVQSMLMELELKFEILFYSLNIENIAAVKNGWD